MKRYLIANSDNLAGSVERKALPISLLFMGISFILIFGYTTTYVLHLVLGKSQFSVMSRTTASLPSDIKIDITSAYRVNGIAGQFIKIDGIITNLRHNEKINGGIAYISIVDTKNKIPIDLEDWSAEKGLCIPFIEASQSLPLEWNVRLVKAGSYTIDILFNKDGDFVSPPITSSKVFLEVAPKLNLNPGNVLPIAFGVPALIMGVLGVVSYIRGRKMGIYG